MFASFSNSWRLVKASYAVLQSDKELIVYPIVSGIGLMLVSAAFLIPMIGAGMIDNLAGSEGDGIMSYLVLFLFYVVTYTVMIFANCALVGAAAIRLNGGDPTVRDGFRIASERAGTIVGYALIAATVGMVLRAISERASVIGRIVISIIGFAWSVATFLVVPVLVNENLGPIDAVKRSAELLRQTWGEQLVGSFSINTILGLVMVGIVILGVVLIMVGASADSVPLIMFAVIALVIAIIIISLIGSTLNGIYQAALYQYAVKGDAGEFFETDLIKGAFKPKRA
jgi:hypothetical protein